TDPPDHECVGRTSCAVFDLRCVCPLGLRKYARISPKRYQALLRQFATRRDPGGSDWELASDGKFGQQCGQRVLQPASQFEFLYVDEYNRWRPSQSGETGADHF